MYPLTQINETKAPLTNGWAKFPGFLCGIRQYFSWGELLGQLSLGWPSCFRWCFGFRRHLQHTMAGSGGLQKPIAIVCNHPRDVSTQAKTVMCSVAHSLVMQAQRASNNTLMSVLNVPRREYRTRVCSGHVRRAAAESSYGMMCSCVNEIQLPHHRYSIRVPCLRSESRQLSAKSQTPQVSSS